jgi:hypothetical protein
MKRRDRNGLMKVFIHELKSRYACARSPQADRAQKTTVSGSQLTREREVTHAPSGIANRAAPAGHRPRVRETRRHKKRCVVMNATGLGILQRNAPPGSKREPGHLIRQVENTRPSVRSTRVHPEASPHGKTPDGQPRIRET